MNKSVVIIGAGLGGLFTGAMLAKEGLNVTIVEKNATIGGGLQSFKRFGVDFDTGMHVIAGMNEGGSMRKICKYLNISDKIQIRHVDPDCTDRLFFAEDKQTYKMARGKSQFIRQLAEYFPEERQNIENYVESVYKMTEKLSLLHLKPSEGHMNLFADHADEFIMAADDYIAKYVGNTRLRSILAFMNPLYGGRGQQTPAFIHAIITTLYINGSSRFVGGSQRFAQLLADIITDNGGKIITGDPVSWIQVEDRTVKYIKTKNGKSLNADIFISAIHPCSMFRLMDEKALPKAYRNRLDSLPNAYSAFSLFIKFKKDRFPYINHSVYYTNNYADIWNFGRMDKPWPMGFLFMTPPDTMNDKFATKALVTVPMNFEMVKKWENTTVGHRGKDYEAWKQERTKQLLEKIEEMFPGFYDAVDKINAASPLTIRDFYGVKEGTISGFSKDCNNIAASQVPVVTKIQNLLLTGQNNNLHGFCGVPLTAINTCEAILGKNYIINKINECQEN